MLGRLIRMREDLERSVRNQKFLDHLPKKKKVAAAPAGGRSGAGGASTSGAGGASTSGAGGASTSGAGGASTSGAGGASKLKGKGASVRARKPSFKALIATIPARQMKPELAKLSAKEKAAEMARDVRNDVLEPTAWDEIEFLVDVCKPIYELLRFCDSNKAGIGKLYYRFSMLLVWVEACAGDGESQAAWKEYRTSVLMAENGAGYKVTDEDLFMPSIADFEEAGSFKEGEVKDDLIRIINKRWEFVHRDAHAGAYALDPESWGHISKHDPAGEVIQGLYRIFELLTDSVDEAARVRDQWVDYKLQLNSFSGTNAVMWRAARTMTAHLWWFEYALPKAPELAKLAMRLLSICMSSSGIERVWSAYEFIHDRRRNRLRTSRAGKLVEVFSNMKLVRTKARKAAAGLEGQPIPWMWTEEGGEEEDAEDDEHMSEVEGEEDVDMVEID
jgi:hypothetical protein